jgi:hypothetical protein
VLGGSFRNRGMSLLSMRSDSPIEIVRFRWVALLGVIRRREWTMFLWVLTHCCRSSIERVKIPISVIVKPLEVAGERYSKSIAIIVTPAVPGLSQKFDTRRSAKFLDDWVIRLVSVTCRCLPHGA